jgi:hypothetical protein
MEVFVEEVVAVMLYLAAVLAEGLRKTTLRFKS